MLEELHVLVPPFTKLLHIHNHVRPLTCIICNIIICIIINHLNEHIPDKLGKTVKRQTETPEKGWEGSMVVKIPNE